MQYIRKPDKESNNTSLNTSLYKSEIKQIDSTNISKTKERQSLQGKLQMQSNDKPVINLTPYKSECVSISFRDASEGKIYEKPFTIARTSKKGQSLFNTVNNSFSVISSNANRHPNHFRTNSIEKDNKINISPIKRQTPHEQSELFYEQINIIPTDKCIVGADKLNRKSSTYFNPVDSQNKQEGYLNIGMSRIYQIPQRRNCNTVRSLSQILLKNKSTHSNVEIKHLRLSLFENRTSTRSNHLSTSPSKKFIKIALAALSGKGPNCENRPITRKMRNEKGGVIDFNTKTIQPVYKVYSVKKFDSNKTTSGDKNQVRISVKQREIAARLIQQWWREILSKFDWAVDKIKKIQSVFRGYSLRNYLMTYFQSKLICEKFTKHLNSPIVKMTRRGVFEFLKENFGEKFKHRVYLRKLTRVQKLIKRRQENRRKITKASHALKSQAIKDPFIHLVSQMRKIRYENLKRIFNENISPGLKIIQNMSNRNLLLSFKHKVKKYSILPQMIENIFLNKENLLYKIVTDNIIKWSKVTKLLKRKENFMKLFLMFLKEKLNSKIKTFFYDIKNKGNSGHIITMNHRIKQLTQTLRKKTLRDNKKFFTAMGNFTHLDFYKNKIFNHIHKMLHPFMRKTIKVLKFNQIQRNTLKKPFCIIKNKLSPVCKLNKVFLAWKIKCMGLTTLLNRYEKGLDLIAGRKIIKKRAFTLIAKQAENLNLRQTLMRRLFKKNEKKLRSYFNQWKLNSMKISFDMIKLKLQNKLMLKPIRNLMKNRKVLDLSNTFLHWKEMALLQTVELTTSVNSGLSRMNKIFFALSILPSFLKIKNTKNFSKSFKLIIPIVNKQISLIFRSFIDNVKENKHLKDKSKLNGIILKAVKIKFDKLKTFKTYFDKWRSYTKRIPLILDTSVCKIRKILQINAYQKILRPAMKTADIGLKAKIPIRVKKVVVSSIKWDSVNIVNILRQKFLKWKQLTYKFKNGMNLLNNLAQRTELKKKFVSFQVIKGRNIKFKLIQMKLKKFTRHNHQMRDIFTRWRNKLNENTFKDLFTGYLALDPDLERKILISRPKNILIDMMKSCFAMKKNSAKKISDFFQGILGIKTKLQKIKRQNAMNNIFNSNQLRYAILRKISFNIWKTKAKESELHESSKVIQTFIKNQSDSFLENRNKQQNLLNFHRKSKILHILSNLSKDMKYKQRLCFLLWKKLLQSDQFNTAARIIQKFFQYVNLKKNKFVNHFNILKTFKGLQRLQVTFGNAIMRYPFEKIRQEAQRRTMIKFVHYLRNKRLNNFNYGFKRFVKYVEVKSEVQTLCVSKIQNIFRMRYNKNKFRNLLQKLRKMRTLVSYAANKNLRCKDSFFKKWKRLSKLSFWNFSSIVLQNFLRRNLERRRTQAKRKIHLKLHSLFNDHMKLKVMMPFFNSLTHDYRILKGIRLMQVHTTKNFISKFKKTNTVNKIQSLEDKFNFLSHQRKQNTFEILKANSFRMKVDLKLKNLCNRMDNLRDTSALQEFYRRWKSAHCYYKKIFPVIQGAFVNKVIQADRRNKLFKGTLAIKLKVIKHLIDNTIKRRILTNIKMKSYNIKKMEVFSKSLMDLDKNLIHDKVDNFKKRIYRLFTYKILLKNLVIPLENKLSHFNKLKQFLNNLNDKVLHKSHYSGKFNHGYTAVIKEQKKNQYVDQTTKTEVKLLNSGKIKKKRMSPYIYLTPLMMNIISKIVHSKLDKFMVVMKERSKGGLLNEKLKKISKDHLPKREIFLKIMSSGEYMQQKREFTKFSQLISKQVTRNLTNKIFARVSKIIKLMHLVKLTLLHRHIAKQNYLRAILRKLSLYSRMKQISKNKMSNLYKNMNLSYLMEAEDTSTKQVIVSNTPQSAIISMSDDSYLKYFK